MGIKQPTGNADVYKKSANSRNSKNTISNNPQKSINKSRKKLEHKESREKLKSRTKQTLKEDPKMRIPNQVVKTKTSVNDILNLENANFETNNKISNEMRNLATMILAEAGGEGETGMVAVGYAIMNRSRLWGKSINSVLFERGQFSPVADGRFKRMQSKVSAKHLAIAQGVVNGSFRNPIGNATFFQTIGAEGQKKNWQRRASNLRVVARIGSHIFRSEKRFA